MNKRFVAPIVILHFNPLERYPPIINLLNFLGENSKDKFIVISTNERKDSTLKSYQNPFDNIDIRRTDSLLPGSRLRIFSYLHFYLYSLLLLATKNSKSVLYFETISSWPALFYKKRIKNQAYLFVHYHEYLSPREYLNNMRLVKWMHKLESKMYDKDFNWISHTNEQRMQKFITDHGLEKINRNIFHTMPNYPSINWAKEKTVFGRAQKIRLVYVGSLGYDTMYLKEIVDWVILNVQSLSLDIYSHNMDEKAKRFLQTIQADNVRCHEACNYEQLPAILKNFDVGLVIYKPTSGNWIYNAPNKVFEYVACGLDVWFSKTMTYTTTFAREKVFPKMMPVDFEKLNEFDFRKAVNRQGLSMAENSYYYENVYPEIFQSLNQ